MLQKIGIENFKAFGEYSELELSQLTVIAGLNSSGKSTIYQALLLLIQSEHERIVDSYGNRIPCLNLNGDFFIFGKNKEILNDKTKLFVRFVLTFNQDITISYEYSLISFENRDLLLLSKISYVDDGQDYSEYTVLKENDSWVVEGVSLFRFINPEIAEILAKSIKKRHPSPDKIKDIGSREVKFHNVREILFRNNSFLGFTIPIKDISQCIDPEYLEYFDIDDFQHDLEKNDLITNKIRIYNTSYEPFFSNNFLTKNNIDYIPPFRGNPQRIYLDGHFENPLDPSIYNDNDSIQYFYDYETDEIKSGTMKEAIKFWVSKRFGIADDVYIQTSMQEMMSEIFLVNNDNPISINNVGFGISQILPVIFKTLSISRDKLIIIDEPEIHLHPSMQSKLADFFFNMSLLKKNIFIESHSEYLIDKLIFLTIKYEKFKKYTNLVWIKNEKNNAFFEKIEYDDLGYLLNSPFDFLCEKRKLVEELNELRLGKII